MADKPARRWRFPLIVSLITIAGVVFIQTAEFFEGYLRSQITLVYLGVGLILLAGWCIFATGLRWRSRLTILFSILFLVILSKVLLRSDGAMSGSGIPRVVWRWTPKPAESVQPIAPVVENASVNLSTLSAQDYPQFLGTERRSLAFSADFQTDWKTNPPRQLWRQPIGAGWSSFAIVNHYAITQEQRGEKELVVCYDLLTGATRWVHENAAKFVEPAAGDGPRATPTVFGGNVYAMGATGILNCLDGASGKVLWSHNILSENNLKNLTWGKSCSPLIADDMVVVSGSDQSAPSLLAYDCKTGALRWKNGADPAGYSSPTLATLAGIRQILVINAESVSGHALSDGAVLWRHPFPGTWAKASQPIALDGDRVFISAGYGLGCAMLQISAQNGACAVKELWHTRTLKTQFSTAVVRDGFAYGLDDQTLACIDLTTGERKWKDGKYGYGQVLLAGSTLIIQAEAGEVALVEASPGGFHEFAKIDALSSRTWSNPALAGEYLLVRNDREAICFKLAKK